MEFFPSVNMARLTCILTEFGMQSKSEYFCCVSFFLL